MNSTSAKFHCEICNRDYFYEGSYLKHKLTHNHEVTNISYRFICQYCGRSFSRKANMQRHMESACRTDNLQQLQNQFNEKIQTVEDNFKEKTQQLEQKVASIEKNPQQVTNVLQVVCVSNNDNYLDMLSQSWGFDKALQYVKDCALSNLSGDVQLIEKIYFSGKETPIVFLDKKRGNLLFINENNEKIIDLKGHKLTQILANNLQNTYLKGVNHLINQTLDNRRCPNQLLEEYDLQM